ncbi:DUF503 domain-containing protein [bacterium CPR1]|nr:DUF503 domain-containing protein [bacterium CPR1]
MYVGICRYDLHLLSGPQSLKEKRAVVRRLRDRLRNLQLSAAEVDAQDLWQRAVLGVACVGADAGVARGQLEAAGKLIASLPEVEVLGEDLEVMAYP